MTSRSAGIVFAVGACRFVYVGLVAIAILAYGSSRPLEQQLVAIGFAALGCVVALLPPGAGVPGRSGVWALAVGSLLAGAAALQSLPLPDDVPDFVRSLVPPAWALAAPHVDVAGRVALSVAPGAGWASLPSILAPALAFAIGLVLYGSDRGAASLLRWLAGVGALVVVIGLVQTFADPGRVLFQDKVQYRGDLTGTFVNRNTAATFFGVTLLLGLGCLFHVLKVDAASRRRPLLLLGTPAGDPVPVAAAGWSLVSLASVAALALTGSRMGLIATSAGVLAMLAAARWRGLGQSLRPGMVLAGLGLVALLAWIGQSTLRRALILGGDDARVCLFGNVVRAILDNPIAGTGFGAFYEAFPPYQDPSCGGFGVFDRAHSVYLELAYGIGVPLAAAIVGMILVPLLVQALSGASWRNRYRYGPALLLGATVLVALHGAVDFSLQTTGFAVFAAAALVPGVVLAVGRDAGGRAGGSGGGPFVVALRVGLLGLSAAGIAAIRPELVREAGSGDLQRIAFALENRGSVTDADLDRVLDQAVRHRLAESCRPDLLRALVTVHLVRFDRTPDKAAEPGRAAEAAVVEALRCLPQEGNLWLRLAIVRHLSGQPLATVVPLLVLSQRFAPAEEPVVATRVRFLAGFGQGVAEAGPLLIADLRTLVQHWPTARIVHLAKTLPPWAAAALLDQVTLLDRNRRMSILAEFARDRDPQR